ncbi:uncharacterized protein FA14DRAFT_158441 [Meira miltonrushii]|uniref:Uncharacterized protein n=1 Tax=Meira miltonrushii TaxID=1280837 RepID=A0A316V240_9BASI|nr:uncharacterized protein FA14DRAFT_158441 [Meira miltonrushii]PWN31629.1 hypothetical protein FA14DRAFT_158441 [Meira miltonrushii]
MANRNDEKANESTTTNSLSELQRKRLANNAKQRRRYQKVKKNPEAYANLLKSRRENKIRRFQKADDKTKAEIRLKHVRANLISERKRRERDPSYRKYDARAEVRKRVREGRGTEEDKQRLREINEKNKLSKMKSRSAKEASLSMENERSPKKRRTSKS